MLEKTPRESSQVTKEITWKGERIRVHARRVIVKFKPIAEGAERTAQDICDALIREFPGTVLVRPPKPSGRTVFAITTEANLEDVLSEIAARPEVDYAEPDVIDRAQIIPSDTRYSDQWALPRVNAETAWDRTTGAAAGVLIGIIDSGISASVQGTLDHPDLDDATRYLFGTDFVDGGTPRDLNSHGTHVAGIAAAESNNSVGVCGINWNTPVYICRTLDANGNGSSADFADALEEIVDYAIAHGLRVAINYSGGGAANQTKEDACRYASDQGMILCAAAGNDNGGPVIFPAAYSTMFDGVIAVGSTDNNDTVSSFSNAGPEVTVIAPGRDILSTTPTYMTLQNVTLNYDFFSGTSMATPLVTGLCALMWSRHPSHTNRRIKDCLTSTAVKLGAGNFDNAWGFGRVDAEAAVRCGDLTFTFFTPFTSFTPLTRFTLFTQFTNLTRFTPFTPLTRFTFFTPLTRFTRFTRFSAFTPFSVGPGPGPGPDPGPLAGLEAVIPVEPFVRYGTSVFAPEELRLDRFELPVGALNALHGANITRLDKLASIDPQDLARRLGTEDEVASLLIATAQDLMRQLAEQ